MRKKKNRKRKRRTILTFDISCVLINALLFFIGKKLEEQILQQYQDMKY